MRAVPLDSTTSRPTRPRTGPGRTTVAAALLAALACVLVGCTGSDTPDPTSVTGAPTTKGATAAPGTPAGVPLDVDVRTLPADTPTLTGWFRLQTLFSQESDRCLEANTPADASYLAGASFMDRCQNVSGQAWQVRPSDEDGYVRLQPRSGVDGDLCLDGGPAGSTTHLSPCGADSTQQWRTAEASGGFRLQTMDAATGNLCLEGNLIGPGAVQDGAAFQDGCQDVSGQVWTVTSVDDGQVDSATARQVVDLRDAIGLALGDDLTVRYQLQSTTGGSTRCLAGGDGGRAVALTDCASDPGQRWQVVVTSRPDVYQLQSESGSAQQLCLAGTSDPSGATDAAAGQQPCTDDAVQQWRFVPDGQSYRLQPLSALAENGCLEGNSGTADGRFGGSSFVDLCQNVTGQLWTLVPVPGTQVTVADAPVR